MNKILLVITALIFNTFLLTENDPFEEINRTTLKLWRSSNCSSFVIDINKINRIIKIGDFVEIINDKYDIEMLAKDTLTVSQDVLTSFGSRIRKIYK